MRLDGKTALITGAATGVVGKLMGFGGATARLFAREGARVVVADLNEEMGEETASQIRGDGAEAMFVRLDVTSEQDWMIAIRRTVTGFGRLDILVNCAGDTVRATVEETTMEMWDHQMDVHAKGAFL
jgi:NAD(P)-dependent dehydrogenase (short-subunit alcohol dehydrogenase family)